MPKFKNAAAADKWAQITYGCSSAEAHRINTQPLQPAKGVEAAQRHLLACLNEGKAERLDPEHVLLIAKLARDHGCHAYAQHVAHVLSYADPIPVEPKDEADELRRQFIESTRALTKMAERIEQLERPALRSAA